MKFLGYFLVSFVVTFALFLSLFGQAANSVEVPKPESVQENQPPSYTPPVGTKATGCISQVREQMSEWKHKSKHDVPGPWGGARVTIVANLIYDHCKVTHKGRYRAAQPKWVNFCYFLEGNASGFDGVKVDPYVYDDAGKTWNFQEFKILDKGRQNCASQGIPAWARPWMHERHDPRWNVWSQVVRTAAKDMKWHNWKTPRGQVRHINVRTDTVLGRWRW